MVVGGGPLSVTVHVGDKGEEGPPAAATAKRQEDDEDEGVTPRKSGAAA